MRYSISRYDNIYGNKNVTVVANDVYFGREVRQWYDSKCNSIEDAVNSIIGFLGTDDPFNLVNLHYVPMTELPYWGLAYEITKRFHLVPYGNAVDDNTWHSVTDIIKIEDKTTIFYDWSWKNTLNPNYSTAGTYRGGGWTNTVGFYQDVPWKYDTGVGQLHPSPTDYSTYARVNYMALPSDAITDGVFTLTEETPIAEVSVSITASDINIITGNPDHYTAEVSIYYYTVSDTAINILNEEETNPQDDPNNDPFSDDPDLGGESTTGGGHYSDPTGTYSGDSDANPVPNLPSISSTDTGFITLFNPTATQLKNLAQYMWGSVFDITTWKKVFSDPMDCILGLSIVPVDVPSSGTDVVKVGNVSTGIAVNKANSQFIEVDCGSINITEKWKAYLDYAPYTKLNIYLPYIGAYELNIDDIQVNSVGVKYHIDILSGACVAYITAGGNVIAQYSGQCAVSIPITSKDFTQTLIALGTLVAGGISAVASGGLSAPLSSASVGGMVTAASTTAANVITSKPSINKSGNMSGSNGLMGVQTPYLFITRPKQCAPKNQNKYSGYPSYITERIGSLSGFTQMQDVRLNGISCTDEERNEILSLLRSGVIL